MTEKDIEVEFEKLLIPIKELYSEITNRGTQFCYPFIYTDGDGDYLSYITRQIKAFCERVKKLDGNSILILNRGFDTIVR